MSNICQKAKQMYNSDVRSLYHTNYKLFTSWSIKSFGWNTELTKKIKMLETCKYIKQWQIQRGDFRGLAFLIYWKNCRKMIFNVLAPPLSSGTLAGIPPFRSALICPCKGTQWSVTLTRWTTAGFTAKCKTIQRE